jgi:hypothetical protein
LDSLASNSRTGPEGFRTTIGYFKSAPRDVPYLGYSDALTISQARPDFSSTRSSRNRRCDQQDYRRPESRGHRGLPGRQDRRNSATSSRAVSAPLATSDVELLAGGALGALAANREAIGN